MFQWRPATRLPAILATSLFVGWVALTAGCSHLGSKAESEEDDEDSVEFVELDRPHRLVWTWGWEPGTSMPVASGSSTIEVELVPDGDGTLLRFTHSGLPDADATKQHAHGWDHYLGRLAIVARGDDPGRDTWLDEMK